MNKGKKIQPGILIHFRRIVVFLTVYSFVFYSYVSANSFCTCCRGVDIKNDPPKKAENCCSAKTSEKKHHNCPDSEVDNSTQDWNGCKKSCGGHLTCSDNNYSTEIIPIFELNIQNFLTKYILTSFPFLVENTIKQIDYFSSQYELNNNLGNIPLTIPLRI